MNDDELTNLLNRLRRFGKKLSDDPKDEYYESQAARIDTIIGDSKTIWMQIISAKKEFDTTDHPQVDFYSWLNDNYGVKLKLTPSGEMSLENEITDDQKYLIFMLKHPGK